MGPGRKKRSGPVPAWALKVASVVMTLSVFGSGLGYASTHLSTTNAPLQPAVVASTGTTTASSGSTTATSTTTSTTTLTSAVRTTARTAVTKTASS